MKILEHGLSIPEMLILMNLSLVKFNQETIQLITGEQSSTDDDFNI